ncbi:FAD-binding oxidoreductase [Pseudomonadales bacterium]|nr:FAD-binding oxidoreductase [Pseudomonadales bacterium]
MRVLKEDIVIVGAGVVGLTSALTLQRLGRSVVVLDPSPPGSGASFGNAGTIADFAIAPVGSPALLKQLPSLLFDRQGPFSIRQGAIAALLPWLAQFAWQSLPAHSANNMRAIAALTLGAGARWQGLAADLEAGHLIQNKGCLYVFNNEARYQAGRRDMRLRQALGVNIELLNPGHLVGLIAARAEADGVQIVPESVARLSAQKRQVVLQLGNGQRVTARQVVIAAGAHSKFLADQVGDLVPLETERGYHLEYDGESDRVRRPVCAAESGFYMSPMAGRLRVAGTVELGGVKAPPTPDRLAFLSHRMRDIFPDLKAASRSWLGFRPSIPDSRPVISESRVGRQIIYAFGHGHIGLTLAPMTASLVAALVQSTAPEVPLTDYRVNRF